jgi:pyruvate dehydrogenase E2 component (dihydrolipoamide acetyltransferase)
MPSFLMPSLGADMETATLTEWHVKPGDAVKRGEVVASVETAKGIIDIEIFDEGVVETLLVVPGTQVPVGGALAQYRSTGVGASAGAEPWCVSVAAVRPMPTPAAPAATPPAPAPSRPRQSAAWPRPPRANARPSSASTSRRSRRAPTARSRCKTSSARRRHRRHRLPRHRLPTCAASLPNR